MHDTLGMHRWRKQCLKQNVIDSGMCEKTLAHPDPHTATHRTPLPPHNVDTSEPQRRLQKRAFISHRPEPPPESIQHWFVGVPGWLRRWHVMRRERLFRTYRCGGPGVAPTMARHATRAFISHIPDSRFPEKGDAPSDRASHQAGHGSVIRFAPHVKTRLRSNVASPVSMSCGIKWVGA